MATNMIRQRNQAATPPQGAPLFTPRVDVAETPDAVLLYADLPCVASQDLEVRFEGRELTIRGKAAPRHGEARVLYSEYEVGDFQRTFTVGEMIDAEHISAELVGGVLTVCLPKSAALKPRRIEVKAQ
jgi:HSP20 family protein